MKKIFALALTLALVLSMGTISAFAANPDAPESHDVKGSYSEGQAASTVYSVEITWGSMEFTYTDASEGTWDADSRTFTGTTPAAWSVNATDGDKITVTNSSNAGIAVSLAFAKDATNAPEVTGSFTIGSAATAGASFNLATAVGTEDTVAPSNFAKFVPGGSISTGSNVKIGSITVTLS